MCFSPTASFSSAAVLVSVGAVATYRNQSPSRLMYASIPILFGIQQAAEGLVWLTMDNQSTSAWHDVGVVAFLSFAMIVWPTWIPFSIFKMETGKIRRRCLLSLCAIGVFGSVYSVVILVLGVPQTEVIERSINYTYPHGTGFLPAALHLPIYFLPTVTSFFISSKRMVRLTGFMFLTSLIITLIVKEHTVTSVWCFFAALMSIFIAVSIREEQSELSHSLRV